MFVGSCLLFRGETEYNCHVSFCFITHTWGWWVQRQPPRRLHESVSGLCCGLTAPIGLTLYHEKCHHVPVSSSLSLSLSDSWCFYLSLPHIYNCCFSLQPSSLPSLSSFITREAVTTQGHTVRVTGRWIALGKVKSEIKIWPFHHWSIGVIACLRKLQSELMGCSLNQLKQNGSYFGLSPSQRILSSFRAKF